MLARISPFCALVTAALLLLPNNARAAGPRDSTLAAPTSLRCPGCFVTDRGERVPFAELYDHWFSAARRRPRYALAALDELVILGLGTSYYWIRPSINKEDWDFESWGDRVRNLRPVFDNNAFATNNVLHPVAGATYYAFARENDLSPFEAYGYSILSSALFEFVLEWLEKVSINDLIVTPSSGAPAGEFVFQLSEYLNSGRGPGSVGESAAKYSLGAPTAAFGWQHSARRAEQRSAELPPDNLGLSSAWWHRFRLSYGVGEVENDHHMSGRFERLEGFAELVAMPGFLKPGTFATTFGWGNFNEARLRLDVRDQGLMDYDARFESVLAGYYVQDLRGTPSGLSGSSALIGYGMGWRYVDRDPLRQHDRYSFAHLAGPVGKSWLAWHGLLLELFGAASFDFGAVDSLAYALYAQRYGNEGMKSVEQLHGYSFVRGVSGRAGFVLKYGDLTLGARAGLGTYQSIQGQDREQSKTFRDAVATDDIFELGAFAAGSSPLVPIDLRVELDELHRHSRLLPVIEARTDRSVTGLLGVRF